MRRLASLFLALTLTVAVAAPAAAVAIPRWDIVVLAAQMTGAAERPNPGDPDGRGMAAFMLNLGTNQLCYAVFVMNVATPFTGNHIHLAPPSAAGPFVVHLVTPNANGIARDCIPVESQLLRNIANNPGGYYINTHNQPYPGGAVRGQLFNPRSMNW